MVEENDRPADSGFVEISGRFEISEDAELISHTASSDIYKVVYGGIRRVLKVPAVHNRDSKLYSDMLRKEWEILSNLSHPGVVMPVGIQRLADGKEGIVQEWIDGVTLNEFLSGNPERSVRRSLAIQMLDIVGYLHSKGVAHRDIKPTNLMVTNDGNRLKLIDFNLADMAAHTRLKFPAGTDGYMSQHQKETYAPSLSDDMFALGKVLEEVLSDRTSRKIAKRCAEGYYDNALKVKESLQNVWARPGRRKSLLRIIIIATIACGIVAVISVNLFTDKLEAQRKMLTADIRAQKEAAEVARQKSDSIHREDSLALNKIKEEQALVRELQVQHEAQVTEIYKGGEAGIDKIWKNSENIENTYDLHQESQKFVKAYVAEQSHLLSEVEVTTLERVMTERWKKHSDLWRKTQQKN